MEHNAHHDENPVVIPLVDEQKGLRTYHPRLLWFALLGGALGALLIGWVSSAAAIGYFAISGLGQIATGGGAVAIVAGAGIGLALGGLGGALVALYRMPRRSSAQGKRK